MVEAAFTFQVQDNGGTANGGVQIANKLVGGPGNDALNGSLGNDLLDGGLGQNVFTFDTLPRTGNIDTILAFNATGDVISLESAIFNIREKTSIKRGRNRTTHLKKPLTRVRAAPCFVPDG